MNIGIMRACGAHVWVDDVLNNVCPTCGNKPGAFKDALSQHEFTISGLCQKCQDEIFTENPNEAA